jgi:hypothetical protein
MGRYWAPISNHIMKRSHRPETRRRTRKNKSSNLDTQDARLGVQGADSLIWNINAQSIPRFGRSDRFDNKVHNIIQTSDMGVILTTSTTVNQNFGMAFVPSANFTQFGSWASVFDQYKVVEVEVWFTPVVNNNTAAGQMYSIIDYDSVITTTVLASFLQYTNVMVSPLTCGHYRKWKPHVAVGAYTGSVFGGYKNVVADWVDCGSPDVRHYGIALLTEPTSASVQVKGTLRAWLQFRNTF